MLNYLNSINALERKIDNYTKTQEKDVLQGEYEDCGLISGILSNSYTETGNKLIKETIQHNPDECVDMKYQSRDKSYQFSKYEMMKYNFEENAVDVKYSTDNDVPAFGIAAENI